MSLEKIMSVSGLPGLFRLVAQNKSGFVVESIAGQKRTVVNARQRVSMLKDITVYTRTGDKPLREILLALREKHGAQLPVNPKSDPAELKKFFESVVPDYDPERVYLSDIKKIVGWYALLDGFSFEEEKEGSESAAAGDKAGKEVAGAQAPAEKPGNAG
jgi:hypothetical protein